MRNLFKSTLFAAAAALLVSAMPADAWAQKKAGKKKAGKCKVAVSAVAKAIAASGGSTAEADAKAFTDAFSKMRKGCRKLQTCRSKCRKAKRRCANSKKGVQCKTRCGKLEGKKKKQCMKKCRAGKKGRKVKGKGGKGPCGQVKKKCMKTCRKFRKAKRCKSRRNAFWNELPGKMSAESQAVVTKERKRLRRRCRGFFHRAKKGTKAEQAKAEAETDDEEEEDDEDEDEDYDEEEDEDEDE